MTELKYVFPWQSRPDGSESFSLLDGAIRASIRKTPGTETYTAVIEPVLVLGDFPARDAARAAVERHVSDRVNAMLGAILPDEVKRWLMQPL